MSVTLKTRPWRIFFAGLMTFTLLLGACQGQSTETLPTDTPAAPPKGYQVQGEVNPTQQAALEKLGEASETLVEVLAKDGQVKFLTGDVKIPDSEAPSVKEKALLFLKQNEGVFQIKNIIQNLKFDQKTSEESGNSYVRFSQQFQGVPVHSSSFLVFVGQNGSVSSVIADYVPNLQLDVMPTVRSIHAEETALEDLHAEDGKVVRTTTLEIYEPCVWESECGEYNPRLAWFVTVAAESRFEVWLYIVDAQDGSILDRMNLILEAGTGVNLEIWELNTYFFTEHLVMTETGAIKDQDPSDFSQNAYNHALDIYVHYYDAFGRLGYIDNEGGEEETLVIKVNVGLCRLTNLFNDAYTMAFWNPTEKYIYFCGDFTGPPDIMNHEYTHAVMGSEVQLAYVGEPRELNEAFSDMFAAFASEEDSIWQLNWPIEDDEGDTILRDMEEVKQGFKKDYPIHYDERYCNRDNPLCVNKCPEYFGDYHETYPDCGHANSLVFSHAAYLMSKEANEQTGISRERLQYLYYEVMTNWLQKSTGQEVAAYMILDVCQKNANGKLPLKKLSVPFTLQECQYIKDKFKEVGVIVRTSSLIITPTPSVTPSSTPAMTLSPPVTLLTPTVTPAPNTNPPASATPTPPNWEDDNDEWLNIDLEKIINDLLKKFEDWINSLIDEALKSVESGFEALLQEVWVKFLEFLKSIAQQCCMGLAPLILLPSGLLLNYRRKRLRNNP